LSKGRPEFPTVGSKKAVFQEFALENMAVTRLDSGFECPVALPVID